MHRRHHHRRNPAFFGFDVERTLAKVGGASFSQFLAAQFGNPLVAGFVPGGGGTAMGRAADGVVTIAAAEVSRFIADLIGLRHYGDDVRDGGQILGGAKIVSAVIPAISLTATYPQALNRFGLPGGLGGRPATPAAAPGLPAPSQMTGAGQTTQALPLPAAGALAGSVTNYSQPANVADDAGI